MTDAHSPLPIRIERRLAAPMFVLAYLFLLLVAGVVHLLRELDPIDGETTDRRCSGGGALDQWSARVR